MERPNANQIVKAKKKLNEIVSDMSYRKGAAEASGSFEIKVSLNDFTNYIKVAARAVEYFEAWLEER